MKNIETLISLVSPYANMVEASKMKSNEKYTAMELLSGPRKTVNIPPTIAKLIKYPAINTVRLIMSSP